MLTAIIRFALRFRGVIIVLAGMTVGYGIFSLGQARLNVFPEFAPPQAIVQTEAPGLSPSQVERLVTTPLENALQGVTRLATLRSKSVQGLSMITLTFHPGSSIYRDRQAVAQRLSTAASSLPFGVKSPTLLPLASSAGIVLTVGLTASPHHLMALRTLADWVVKPQLLSVPGVADVAVFGGQVKQLQIQLRPAQLVRYGLSVNAVVHAARRATGMRGAGFIANRNQRFTLTLHGLPMTARRLAMVVVAQHHGASVRLGDVARVIAAPAPAVGAAAIHGKTGVMLVVEEQVGADTLTLTRALERKLAQLKPALTAEQATLYPDLFRPANFIDTAIGHLRTALLVGAALVVAVLFLFLFNFRAALISALAIPLSLLTATIILHWLGAGLNTMTLGGLAIALGEVVDDAIIDVENILRRLRENRMQHTPLPVIRVVLNASAEVRGAVVYATFIVALAFLPVLTLPGVAGKLFSPLAIAYIAAILASLLVALTVTPALSYLLLARGKPAGEEPPLIQWLHRHYRRLLEHVERRSALAITAVVLLCVAAFGTLPFLGADFLPQLREGHYIVHMRLLPGASLAQSLRLGQRVTATLSQIPGVRSVAQRVGRAERISDPSPIFASEFDVDLRPLSGSGQQHVLQEIRHRLTAFAGARFAVNTFLTERINETMSGGGAPLAVDIYGNNLDVLDRKAAEVAAVLRAIPGAQSVWVRAPGNEPQLAIRLRLARLRHWGIAPLDAVDAIQTAYQGTTVGQVAQGNRTFNVTVALAPRLRRSPTQIGALPLRTPDGKMIPLRDVAAITQAPGRYLILHRGAQRLQTVAVNVSGRALSRFVAEAKQRIAARVKFPPGTYALFSGDMAARAQAQRDLLTHAALAAVGIGLLLFLALNNRRAAVLVAANLPFAAIGGIAVVLLSGAAFSIGALVGFVTLFGITLRNSIMLLSHYLHLIKVDGVAWNKETAIRGAQERLAPILMTALVTALGLLPLALTSGAPGNEIEGPMAQVILGGLLTSTVLNLLILPTLALRYGKFGETKQLDADFTG